MLLVFIFMVIGRDAPDFNAVNNSVIVVIVLIAEAVVVAAGVVIVVMKKKKVNKTEDTVKKYLKEF